MRYLFPLINKTSSPFDGSWHFHLAFCLSSMLLHFASSYRHSEVVYQQLNLLIVKYDPYCIYMHTACVQHEHSLKCFRSVGSPHVGDFLRGNDQLSVEGHSWPPHVSVKSITFECSMHRLASSLKYLWGRQKVPTVVMKTWFPDGWASLKERQSYKQTLDVTLKS